MGEVQRTRVLDGRGQEGVSVLASEIWSLKDSGREKVCRGWRCD